MTAIANRRLGFVKRNLRGTPPDVRKMAYVSLVRSKLEYGPTVWDPYYKVHSLEIEKNQNRAIRWIFDKRPREKVSITSLRNQLELDTLEKRRETHKLCFLHKIVGDGVVVTVEDLGLVKAVGTTRYQPAPHELQHIQGNNLYKKSPIIRTIPVWNRLSPEVVAADSVETFKSRLGALRP